MKKEEKEILKLLAKAWNLHLNLPNKSTHDDEEFLRAIHQAQRCIAIRIARDNCKEFKQYNK